LHQLGAYKTVPIAPTTFAQIKPAKINLSLFGRLNHGNANDLAKSAKTRQNGNLLTTKEMPMFCQRQRAGRI
jgi:hypothetical protein